MISRPVISPQAPAGRLQRGARHAGDLAQRLLQPPEQLQRALDVESGCRGWIRWNPASAATVSATLGLYFIVHEPNGYGPVSTP